MPLGICMHMNIISVLFFLKKTVRDFLGKKTNISLMTPNPQVSGKTFCPHLSAPGEAGFWPFKKRIRNAWTLTQFTSLPDTVSQIRREVHERRATVHLDKVPLLMATRKSRWQPADRRVNTGRKGEERRGGGNGRTLSIIRVNDGRRGGQNTLAH